ncbi:HAD-IA family hydrolase [Acidimangrovimonas pyrenivorans]|uniref:HAD-IA family hydrolase n=1 Tax=Acidimangrovimonas pyrenivorans TaxID=2030798 RepID=A0ABV7AIG5_9RHOB
MKGPIRLVVFDVDGTLVDSQKDILDAMARAFEAEGYAVPDDAAVLASVGLSLPEAMAQLAPDLDAAARSGLVSAYRDGFLTSARHVEPPLYPGVRDTLAALRARPELLLGVATGKSRRGLDHILVAHDLEGVFLSTQVADDHPSKPNPSMLLAALRETGAEACNAAMVGDTEYDIAMGRAAGFATVGVSWGYQPVDRLQAAGADVVIDDFAALPAALDRIWES